MKLTDRERSVLDFIRSYLEEHGHSPSVREICKGLGLKSPGSMYKVLSSLRTKGALAMEGGKRRTIRLKKWGNGPAIPVLGRIAAGPPLAASQEIIDELPCDPTLFGASQCFGVVVKGDSMIERHISPGDIAIIEPDTQPVQGMIAAVMVEGIIHEATLKIVKWDDESIRLISANPAYPPMEFRGEERAKVRLLGRLVGIIRRTP